MRRDGGNQAASLVLLASLESPVGEHSTTARRGRCQSPTAQVMNGGAKRASGEKSCGGGPDWLISKTCALGIGARPLVFWGQPDGGSRQVGTQSS